MSDKDCVSRSWLLAEYDRQHEGPAGKARKLIEGAPAVPHEMTAREFLRTLQRKADAENLITVMKFVGNDWSTPPAFGKWVEDTEKWAHEHPETDMMTAKYALPKIDFEEGAKNEDRIC